tara:strand:+ start:1095 stop:1202 length:108 start_codon:yes stop_codon:yes gene_type:complete
VLKVQTEHKVLMEPQDHRVLPDRKVLKETKVKMEI